MQKVLLRKELFFTILHAGGKFDNNAYKTSGGLHGVGSSVVNALSIRMKVRIKTGGSIYEDIYEHGIPVTKLEKGLLPEIGKTRETGTTVNFLTDDTILKRQDLKKMK